jgi:predicted dehydrogenase
MNPPNPFPLNRRRFLKQGALALGATTVLPQILPSRVLGANGQPGANERLTLGFIGLGAMGGSHLRYMVQRGDVNIAAVCDVDAKHLAKAVDAAGSQPTAYRDYRHLLERKDIDAVIIAAPDHWHAVLMVEACESGKHVYVEKPACATIAEGKAMIAAANNNHRCVQVGSQGRATRAAYKANQYLTNGMLGRVSKVVCWHPSATPDLKPVPDSAPPPELDWDLWLGPLRWRPYNQRYCPVNFRWLMECGGGQIRDRGAHMFSLALQFMKCDDTGPVSVEATGTVPDSGLWDVPINMEVTYEFKNPDWTLVWQQPGTRIPYWNKEEQYLAYNGTVYYGDKDKMVVWGGDSYTNIEERIRKFPVPSDWKDVPKAVNFSNHEDWFEGIRTGRKTIMNIEAGVAVANLCILGNLSFLLGRKLHWDPVKKEIIGDEQARRLMSRPQRFPYQL